MGKLIVGVNDLMTKRPDLATQWNYERNKNLVDKKGMDISSPDKVAAYLDVKAWWILPYDVPLDYPIEHLRGKHFDFEWEASIKSRTIGSGCPYLKGKAVWQGFNDLMTINPELASEWNYEKNIGLMNGNGKDVSTPDKVTVCSAQKVWWKCKHGHEWEAKITDRVKGNGCPYCSGRRPIKGKTDLQTTHPEIAAEWSPTLNGDLLPTDVSSGSDKEVWWQCKKRHQWLEKVEHRTRGLGCPYCSGQRVLPGETDLATTNPDIATEWHPTKNVGLKNKKGEDISTPDKVTAGAHQSIWWKCKHGHEWRTSVYHRTRGQGCPVCLESHGEKAIRKILEDNSISFKEQHKFKDRFGPSGKQLLKDDFAIFDNYGNVVGTIEYNGEQHYKPVDFSNHGSIDAQRIFEETKIRDKIKTEYLNAHNIPQLIIPYWEFGNIEEFTLIFISNLPLGIDFNMPESFPRSSFDNLTNLPISKRHTFLNPKEFSF